MGNYFQRKNDGELKALAVVVATVLGGEGQRGYGVSAAQTAVLTGGGNALGTGMAAQTEAQLAVKAATRQKAAGKAATVAALNAIAGVVYPNANVTDEILAAIGFAPRRSSAPQPKRAQAVAGLVALPNVDGSVRLAWERGANGKGTMFLLEASADGASWAILGSTTRVNATVEGYAPGVAAWFRITATTSTSAARPSAAVAIYGPVAPAAVELKVA